MYRSLRNARCLAATLILLLTIAASCGSDDGGGGGGGSGPPADVTIDKPQSLSVATATIALYGEATCDACPRSEAGYGYCPPLEPDRPSAINVTWRNRTTGESGDTFHLISGHYSYFFSYCLTVYHHYWTARVPLVIGDNAIDITASGASWSPSTDSVTITRLPSPIQNLKAVSGKQQVTLSWDPVPDATSYNVYWSTSRNVGTTNGTMIVDVSNPYIHTGLLDNTTYYYVVTAVANGKESVGSNVVWSTPGWLLESVSMMPEGVSWRDIALAVDNAGQAHIHYSYDQQDIGLLSPVTRNQYASNAGGSWNSYSGYLDPGYVNADIALEPPAKVHVSLLSYSGVKHGVVGSALDIVDAAGTCDASLALDASNKAHIVYYSRTGLRYATNSSGAWTNGVIEAFGSPLYCTSGPDSVSLGLDSTGVAHVAYQATFSVGLQYATNAGGTWVISTVWPSPIEEVSLAVDTSGATHIVFSDGSSTLRYANNKSGAWAIETIEDQTFIGEAYLSNPSISLDSADKAHVVYFHSVHREIRHATNGQGNWHISLIDTVDSPLDRSVKIDTAIDTQGKTHFVYFTTKSLRYGTNN